MNRPTLFFTSGLLLLIQTAGITSLPGVLAHTPLTVAVSAYLLNERSVREIWGLILIQGIVFEIFFLGSGWLGLELLAHGGALLACILLSRSVFTNRSFYGLAACAGVSTGILEVIRLLGNAVLHRPTEPLFVLVLTPVFAFGIVGCLFAASRLVLTPSRRERV